MASVIRMFAWCGANTSRSSGSYAGSVHRLGGGLGHRVRGPLEDGVALHPQCRPVSPRRRRMCDRVHRHVPGLGLLDQVGLVAVGAPDHWADRRGITRADHGGPGAVGEDERRRPVGLVVISLSRSTPMISTYLEAPLRMNESAIAVT